MSSDPIKNILRILYDDLTSGVYSILKSVKKIQRPDLERKLKEQNYEYQNLKSVIGQLEKDDFIKIENINIKPPPLQKGDIRKYQKSTKVDVYKYNHISINFIKNKYEEMKEKLNKDLAEREKQKFLCMTCGRQADENFASRDGYKCPDCRKEYTKNVEDVADIRKKCNNIIEILDELFLEEENNSNAGINSNINNYLSSKYGKIFNGDNKPRDTFEEDHDSYINETMEHLTDKTKMNFYELVETYIRKKK